MRKYLSLYGEVGRREWWLRYFLPGMLLLVIPILPGDAAFGANWVLYLGLATVGTCIQMAGTAKRARALDRAPLGCLVVLVPQHGSFASYPIATRAVFVLADHVHLPRPRARRSSSVARGTMVRKQAAAARQPTGGAVRGTPCRRSPRSRDCEDGPGALRLLQQIRIWRRSHR